MKDAMKSLIGWRKVLIYHSTLVSVTWLGLAGKLTSEGLTVVIPAIAMAVIAGNAATHFAQGAK